MSSDVERLKERLLMEASAFVHMLSGKAEDKMIRHKLRSISQIYRHLTFSIGEQDMEAFLLETIEEELKERRKTNETNAALD